MKVEVGSAPDSWGVWFPNDPRQTPWERFLDEISEAGYEWTELGPYGYLPSDLKTLRPELERRGLKVTGSFVMGDLAKPGDFLARNRTATTWLGTDPQRPGSGLSRLDRRHLHRPVQRRGPHGALASTIGAFSVW